MRIRITPKFTKTQVRNDLKKRIANIHQAFYDELQYIGENFVKNARERGNYKDHTGNLRNSVGYIIFQDGEPILENIRQSVVPYKQAAKITNQKDGGRYGDTETDKNALAIARMKATAIAKANTAKGLLLVCVAGMEYAAAVESRGKDVITSSSIEADKELRKIIDDWKSARYFNTHNSNE